MATQTVTEFLGIHLENSLEPGKLRMASTGLGWKGDMQGVATTVAAGDMKWMQWLRVGRGFQLRIGLKSERRRITFEGFPREDHDRLKNTANNYYNITLEDVETSVRGWNWGTSEVRGNDLAFLVQGKHAFTVPLRNVHNTSINKQEVALEFRDEAMIKEVERLSEAQDKESRKLRRTAPDECVEIRFYIPGTVGAAKRRQKAAKKEAAEADGTGVKQKGKGKGVKKEGEDGDVTMEGHEDGEGEEDDDDATTGSEAEGEDQAAAENFFESIKDKTDVGQHTGDTLVAFPDVLCTTPRCVLSAHVPDRHTGTAANLALLDSDSQRTIRH
jgi:structure-specific recognition protein 1